MRILGIDPALRNTGYGILDSNGGNTNSIVHYGVISSARDVLPSLCLLEIYRGLRTVLENTRPEAAAVEGIIFVQSHKTAITLGAARAAAILAITEAGVPLFEYAPRRVKSAATGHGGAKKGQVGFMMRALLGLKENLPPDAADALAIALTHAQSREGLTQGTRI